MEFSSILFLCFFFPLFFLIYYLIPDKWKNKWLLVASIFFLIYGREAFIWYFLLLTGFTYIILNKLNQLPKKISKKKILLWVILIEILIWYLFVRNMNDFIYPISYTIILLSNIGTLLDFYKNKQKKPSLFYYLLYMSCFSKVLFGPILSYYEMEEELKTRKVKKESITKGCFLFLKGVFMNVLLVGMLSEFIQELVLIESILGTYLLLLATILQIGLFMMSYSNMSIGLSTMLGFTFENETKYPLCLYKMKYFLSNWHSSFVNWWDKNLSLLKKKLPFLLQIGIFMMLLSICYGLNFHVLLWFLFIGLGIFIEGMIKKKYPKPLLYLIHFIWLMLSTMMIVRPNILETMNHLLNVVEVPFTTPNTLYYFGSYWIIILISILISCKIVKKITEKFSNRIWYHLIRNVIYIILLWMTLIYLITNGNASIWLIRT